MFYLTISILSEAKGNATLSPKATVTIEEPTKAANLLIFLPLFRDISVSLR